MNIAIIGATGFIGSAICSEALARGHRVTALVGHPEKLATHDNLRSVKSDIYQTQMLATQLSGYDAVISAFSGHAAADVYADYVRGMQSIIAAAKQSHVQRLLVVGGAGSLEVAPGVQLVDTPDFPAQWKASALGARETLKMLRNETQLNWTLLSPSAAIVPGQRIGRFRLGADQLLIGANGSSEISLEDYALAMIDELEKPAHQNRRFTVGY